MSERILITGGTGFVGGHLVEALHQRGVTDLHLTSHRAPGSDHPQPLFTDPALQPTIHRLDLTDQSATQKLFAKLRPTQIFHLASFSSVANSFEQAQTILHNNLTLQLNVLTAYHQSAPTARFLHVGSAESYGALHLSAHDRITESTPLKPVNPYGISKTTQELLALAYAHTYQLPIIATRSFNHTGERQSTTFAIPHFARQVVAIERGTQTHLKVGNIEAIRDFTDVIDVVKAYLILMERGEPGEVYNVGSGTGRRISDMLNQLISFSTLPITPEVDPQLLRPIDVPRIVADNGKMTQLGWQPTTPIEITLARVLDYWRSQP